MRNFGIGFARGNRSHATDGPRRPEQSGLLFRSPEPAKTRISSSRQINLENAITVLHKSVETTHRTVEGCSVATLLCDGVCL